MYDVFISRAQSKPSSGRLLSIDLLRAVAAFGVFVFHAFLFAGFDKYSLSVSIPGLSRALTMPNFLSLGAMGVSLFFVVSGYCLARSRNRGGSAATTLRGYYVSRPQRIYPAYFSRYLLRYSHGGWWPAHPRCGSRLLMVGLPCCWTFSCIRYFFKASQAHISSPSMERSGQWRQRFSSIYFSHCCSR